MQNLDRTVMTEIDREVLDRGAGSLLGLAVGDAVGATLEFRRRDSYEPLTDMVGGGPFHLRRGEWTDDTAMALALADSLIENDGLDEADLLARFCDWQDNGAYSCTGVCFDIGTVTSRALSKWRRTGNMSGPTEPNTAGNGSLMRLAPVAIRYWNDADRREDAAARQSRTTHGAAEAVDACIAYADIIAEAIAGQPREAVLRPQDGSFAEKISAIIGGSWKGKLRSAIGSSGYVAHSLEAALWCIDKTGNFRDAVLLAANLGDDADTTAAITGQLAGALYGMSGIPSDWLRQVAWRERIETMAHDLVRASLRDRTPTELLSG